MALMTIDEYRNTYFTQRSRPAPRTIRRWIEEQRIYGERRGRTYYVDPEKELMITNELVLKVLRS